MKSNFEKKKVDTKELELPETLFVRDIEDKVFQGIVAEVLSHIDGIEISSSNFIESIFGKTTQESYKGIVVEQSPDSPSVSVTLELNIAFGISIPEKAEEIQSKLAEEITNLTGLHVSAVHLIFKNILAKDGLAASSIKTPEMSRPTSTKVANSIEEEYNDEF